MSKSQAALSPLDEKQQKARQFFKNPLSALHYITYEEFFKHFQINESNYKAENLKLIDLHLRYRWYVRQRMAPYKWIPIVCLTPILLQNFWLALIIPYFTTQMFDHYFESFFIWRYKRERIINIRNEFATQLSKQTSKMRRVKVFEELREKLERKEEGQVLEPPHKYIKFGDFTEYVFHARVGEAEQSSLLQTTFFQTFLDVRNFFLGFSQLSILKEVFNNFKDDFIEFKKDSNRTRFSIDTSVLLDRQDIKDVEVYSLQDNFDHNVRRCSELWNYLVHGNLEPSTFKLWEYTNLSNYEDIFEPIQYNIKTNSSDLLLYYSVIAIPKLLKVIFKRR